MPSLMTPVPAVNVTSPEHGPMFAFVAGANVAGCVTGDDCAIDGMDDTTAAGSGGELALKLCAGALVVAPVPCPLAYVARKPEAWTELSDENTMKTGPVSNVIGDGRLVPLSEARSPAAVRTPTKIFTKS